jgi:hypothetical protein
MIYREGLMITWWFDNLSTTVARAFITIIKDDSFVAINHSTHTYDHNNIDKVYTNIFIEDDDIE